MAPRHFGRLAIRAPANEPSAPVALNTDIRAYVNAASGAAKNEPWTAKLEIPSSDEILGIGDGVNPGDAVHLVPNQIDGPWQSTELYLKAHYELLREDAVAPLRDAVDYVRQNPRMRDTLDVCIYEKVHIVGMTCAQSGIAVRVHFSTARAGKNIVWEYSQRLTSGKIVALTPANDGFKNRCIVAVVAARPLEGLKSQPCEVDLFFANPDDAEFDYQQEWLMVESRNGYFEALRHTLTALQKMRTESLEQNIDPPEYVKRSPVVDMTDLYPLSKERSQVHVLEEWPCPPKSLDVSQWKALRQILGKKLAIVQGPPGTGKTHVSVVALKTLLKNMGPMDPPIIIAAQTNHALDQLLRHVADFEQNYVRLGGRSTDAEIKKRTVFELKKKCNIPFIPGGAFRPAMGQYRFLVDQIAELMVPFTLEKSTEPLPVDFFLKLGIITQAQYESLVNGAEGWVHSGNQMDPISAWLGDERLKYDVTYKTENFGFVEDEIDLEYEQLKELEAEQGLDDDDCETLRGQYISLKEGYVGRMNPMLTEKTIREKYLRCDDMWKIPASARGRVYSALQKQAKEITRDKLRALMKSYHSTVLNLKIGRWERDSVILGNAKVIGMTTTGLSKYRPLVASVKPKIILIEEAAEILEAPVAAACVESLEHLILVGDHKQLQGQCAMKDLEGEPFYLSISMFERLVHNGVDFKCLTKQRRMAPEIRRILSPIYDNLEDHEAVLNRPGVPGMGDVSSWFFCHTWPESSDSLLSKYNEREAKMVVGFYLYLHMNGVPAEHITVLTFYNGQRKKILKALKEAPMLQGLYTKVVTIDSYQGEENEIVLLSLVRSGERNIGFLSVENRICVALSRAKRGFYVFGNAEALSMHSALWWEVVQIMRKEPKRLGYYIPVTCETHKRKTLIPKHGEGVMGAVHPLVGRLWVVGMNVHFAVTVSPTKPCGASDPATDLFLVATNAKERAFALASVIVIPTLNPNVPQHLENAVPYTCTEQLAVVQRYRDFANGGAKEADAQLVLERQQFAMKEKLRVADEEAYASLFGDEATNSSPAQNSMVERAPDIEGTARFRFVQYYSSAPVSGNSGGLTKDEPSLLDL
ncbi:DEAD-like helicase superfamily protein [Emydomyces testavorans]|uniref:DEAD-like helicase superfamily protein n=1 Tax=Emydomyces testavorans TaxID=2070801 RepID=A0AAF0DCP5_9EURO|nr:DEAD-like helicase superfamily protein [Emydomyces testavorans]